MNFIVAVTNDYAIGKNNDLLFHLPTDLKYFKETTLNKVVVMGDRTYFSLPKRPLPNRINIVLSNNPDFNEPNVIIVRNLDELFEKLKKYNTNDVFVTGGATVYNLLMDYCDKAYITKIDKIVPADTYIRNIEKLGNWQLESSSDTQTENGLDFSFKVFKNHKVKEYFPQSNNLAK